MILNAKIVTALRKPSTREGWSFVVVAEDVWDGRKSNTVVLQG